MMKAQAICKVCGAEIAYLQDRDLRTGGGDFSRGATFTAYDLNGHLHSTTCKPPKRARKKPPEGPELPMMEKR